MIKKLILRVLLFTIILFCILESLSYAVIWYSNQVPEGYFNDEWRVLIEEQWYKELQHFFQEDYSDFLEQQNLSTSLSRSDVPKKSSEELIEYLWKSREEIYGIEIAYTTQLQKLSNILIFNEFGDKALWDTFEGLMGDSLINMQVFIDHIAHIALLQCLENEWSKRCEWYLMLIERILEAAQRRSTITHALFLNNAMKKYNDLLYLLWNTDRESKWYLCNDIENYRNFFKQAYKDDLNSIMSHTLVIDWVVYEKNMLQHVPEYMYWYYYHNIEDKFLMPLRIYYRTSVYEVFKQHILQNNSQPYKITSAIALKAFAPIPIQSIYENIDEYCGV